MTKNQHKPNSTGAAGNISQIGKSFATVALALSSLGFSECYGQSPLRLGKQGLRLECSAVSKIQNRFFNEHILFKEPTPAIEARTVEQFVKRLDGGKLYLRAGDVEEIKQKMKGLFQQLEDGNCAAIEQAHALFLKRVEERAAFAKAHLNSKDFKFDSTVSIVLDPDQRKYPKTDKEHQDYHKKYMQFQVSNQLATGLDQKEAIQQVLRSYDRGVKRLKEVTTEQLLADYLGAFGRGLDPHTSYFSRDDLEDFEVQMSLSLEGIGASLSSQDGFTVVEQLLDGGSAKSSGLVQPQDKIVAVGQVKPDGAEEPLENVVEMDLREVVKRIRGPKGTKVRLQLLRAKPDGEKERLTVTLNRGKIQLEEDAAQLSYQEREVDGKMLKIAVLNLPSFYSDGRRGGRSAATDVKRLLAEARSNDAKVLVLDLSTNGGGSLEDAVRISGAFIRLGNIVKQSSREGEGPALSLADKDPAVDWSGPLVILTSRVSASASEIVSGALKDYRRAVVVGGDHTFGKGSVQSVSELAPGLGAIKTTVGWFFTPSGFSTQWRGVNADIALPSPFSREEIGEKSLDYSLKPNQIEPFRSAEAKGKDGAQWKEIVRQDIEQLKKRSVARVKSHPEFKKIIDEAKKAKARGKVIKLAESLKESKERKDESDQKKNLSKEERNQEYLKRADIQEALNVAADLFALQNRVSLKKVVIPPPPPEKGTKVAAAGARGKSIKDPVAGTGEESAEDGVRGALVPNHTKGPENQN